MKPRDVLALVVSVGRAVADKAEEVEAFLMRLDEMTCTECRFPLKGEQPCTEGACGDCCARAHNAHK